MTTLIRFDKIQIWRASGNTLSSMACSPALRSQRGTSCPISWTGSSRDVGLWPIYQRLLCALGWALCIVSGSCFGILRSCVLLWIERLVCISIETMLRALSDRWYDVLCNIQQMCSVHRWGNNFTDSVVWFLSLAHHSVWRCRFAVPWSPSHTQSCSAPELPRLCPGFLPPLCASVPAHQQTWLWIPAWFPGPCRSARSSARLAGPAQVRN